ncbi:hypothetical protein LC724_08930 [Blautia sp. RD014234]|nr:hypothetical protein [Blautia parvula]
MKVPRYQSDWFICCGSIVFDLYVMYNQMYSRWCCADCALQKYGLRPEAAGELPERT